MEVWECPSNANQFKSTEVACIIKHTACCTNVPMYNIIAYGFMGKPFPYQFLHKTYVIWPIIKKGLSLDQIFYVNVFSADNFSSASHFNVLYVHVYWWVLKCSTEKSCAYQSIQSNERGLSKIMGLMGHLHRLYCKLLRKLDCFENAFFQKSTTLNWMHSVLCWKDLYKARCSFSNKCECFVREWPSI